MRTGAHMAATGLIVIGMTMPPRAQAPAPAAAASDPVRTLVSRLDLERYKATVKGLTQFGDRRQGTERNRKAVDWIEAQLKSYGCATERIRLHLPTAASGAAGRGAPRRRIRTPGRLAEDAPAAPAPGPASTPTRCGSPTRSCAR